MDHDAFENTVEELCLSRRADEETEHGKRGETYRDLFRLEMGSMTVYRLRLRCSGGLKFLPIDRQHWAAYMGSRGTSLFIWITLLHASVNFFIHSFFTITTRQFKEKGLINS